MRVFLLVVSTPRGEKDFASGSYSTRNAGRECNSDRAPRRPARDLPGDLLQPVLELRAIPVHELDDAALVHGRVRRGIVSRRVHTDLIFLTYAPVRLVGGEPDFRHALDVVVDSLDRILV